MKFIKPKSLRTKVDWQVSENTVALIEYYAKYTGYTPEEVVDQFMNNLSEDEKFVDWANKQRFSKKLKALLDFFDIDKRKEGVSLDESTEEISQ